jgi:hypothetical protein
MNFTSWAKLFRFLGWLNVGIAIFDVSVIGIFFLIGIPVYWLLYLATVFTVICAKFTFYMSNECKVMAQLCKEKEDGTD